MSECSSFLTRRSKLGTAEAMARKRYLKKTPLEEARKLFGRYRCVKIGQRDGAG